ncbi:MAG TPA: response regulator, partial [Bryobacteraceae bacterium]|nr:response regulator [Bryobacteraceae bacterium]
TFRHVADGKGLNFQIELEDELPRSMNTDSKRLQQVLKNLISNALKFTEKGGVTLSIKRATSGWQTSNANLSNALNVIAFEVVDTGIGIPEEKQRIIFEAFRQADGTTSRKYGGTGLGLSISREIARLLGGEIAVSSKPGEGSRFTLFLPQNYVPVVTTSKEDVDQKPESQQQEPPLLTKATSAGVNMTPTLSAEPPLLLPLDVPDDRNLLQAGDRVLLIIEDDATYAPHLVDLAHKRGFKAVVAQRGERGLALAKELNPDAITLDIRLPDMAGWLVLSRLKYDPATRHIPVHVISVDEDYRRGLALGADSYSEKPADLAALQETFDRISGSIKQTIRHLLLVDADEIRRLQTVSLIGDGHDVFTTLVSTGEAGVAATAEREFDCCVISPPLPDGRVPDIISKIEKQESGYELPIIVYSPSPMDSADERELREMAAEAVVKVVRSEEKLLEETAVFLNRKEEDLTEDQRRLIHQARSRDKMLAGATVLIVDDDIRNIFALTSGLERHKVKVFSAESGREGIEALESTPNVDIVLMDIMMPEMDGYETIRRIRQKPELRNLPIIALTAKAMKGDREKCIEAGASDYIPKPVILEELLTVLSLWIPQANEYSYRAAEIADE